MNYFLITMLISLVILIAIAIEEIYSRHKIKQRFMSKENDQRYSKPNSTKWWER